MNNKNLKWIIGAVVVVVFVSIFAFVKKSKVEVEPMFVKKGDMVEATYAVGTVKADKIYNLKTGVNSKMVERFVRAGQKVKKGTPLLKIDSFPTYVAPFDGTVTAINYEVGELVFSNSTVLTLVNDSQLYLELSLDERSIYKVKVGDEANISFESQKKKTKGNVKYVFSNSDQFYVHVFFDSKDLTLLPGMTCDVSVVTRKFENKLLVPVKAINNNFVTLKNGKKVKLNILYRNDEMAAVDNSELNDNDELILTAATHERSKQSQNKGMGH